MNFDRFVDIAIEEGMTNEDEILNSWKQFSSNSNYAAHMSLNKGLASNATPEQRVIIDDNLSDDDK